MNAAAAYQDADGRIGRPRSPVIGADGIVMEWDDGTVTVETDLGRFHALDSS